MENSKEVCDPGDRESRRSRDRNALASRYEHDRERARRSRDDRKLRVAWRAIADRRVLAIPVESLRTRNLRSEEHDKGGDNKCCAHETWSMIHGCLSVCRVGK